MQLSWILCVEVTIVANLDQYLFISLSLIPKFLSSEGFRN
jgi:hypothetical protein